MACQTHGAVNLVCMVLLAAVAAAIPAGSLMRREVASSGVEGKSRLQEELKHVLGAEESSRLFAVEDSIRPSYEAFPKNVAGRLPPKEFVPAIVRNYFAAEHGWLLRGLEPPSIRNRPTKAHEAKVLEDKAPGLAKALRVVEDSDEGFSLSDVVGVIAALEHLIIQESQPIVESAYVLNGLSTESLLDDDALHEVLRSCLLLFRWGSPANLTDVKAFRDVKERAQQAPDWQELIGFERAVVKAAVVDGAVNHTIESVRRIVAQMMQKYGKWQNAECVQMKEALVELARDAEGLVPYEAFHAEPAHASFQFSETPAYLQRIGALYEPWGKQNLTEDQGSTDAQVLVANYLLGSSNCIAPSEYHSVCCLNECEVTMRSIEASARAPSLLPDDMQTVMEQVTLDSTLGPRPLRSSLVDELRSIAHRHEGAVPLHGPDFRLFLHEAFPNDCPLPTSADNDAEALELTAAMEWLDMQQECTRVPLWHPSLHQDVGTSESKEKAPEPVLVASAQGVETSSGMVRV
eukprot:TRINITY_DN60792_c0_g1_i1.p1 TRINITY_DN60792_c0_g1~~TRINITY_DN60792_c0_g1_i1.p1  ORF type:complete len:551 (+),score=99.22 TRINITY_DN60792_c0_g1_i1:98-1654(+)